MLFAILIYQDSISPAVLFNIPWIFSLLGLLGLENFYKVDDIVFFYIIVGSIIFQFGYGIAAHRTNFNLRYKVPEQQYIPKYFTIIVFMIAEACFLTYLYFYLLEYINSEFITNIYVSIVLGLKSGDLELPGWIIYGRPIISVFTICLVIMFFYINTNNKKRIKLLLITQVVFTVANLATIMTRNGALIVLLPIIVSVIIGLNLRNSMAVKYFTRFSLAFMAFFIGIAILKYNNEFESVSFIDFITNNIFMYLSASLVSFQTFLLNPGEYLYGENTFRFFIAIFGRITGEHSEQSLVQEFTDVGDSTATNVYTFYHYYARDFGMIYAMGAQFFVGVLHGASYKAMLLKRPFNIFVFSILCYPLIMQFFQDQYISLLSTWLQFIIIGFIVLKTNVFFSRKQKS
jgi:oligosaccharide repeat unit polymerase